MLLEQLSVGGRGRLAVARARFFAGAVGRSRIAGRTPARGKGLQ